MFEIVYKMFLITLGNGEIIAKLSCDADSLRGDFSGTGILLRGGFLIHPTRTV